MAPYFGQCLFCSKGIQAKDDVSAAKECGHVYHTACVSNILTNIPWGSGRIRNMAWEVLNPFIDANRVCCCLSKDMSDFFKLHPNFDENSILGDPNGSVDTKFSKEGQEKIKAAEEKLAALKEQVALEKARAEIENEDLETESLLLRLKKEGAERKFLQSLLPKERHWEIHGILRGNETEVIEAAKLIKEYDEAKKKADTLHQMVDKAVSDHQAAREEIQDEYND